MPNSHPRRKAKLNSDLLKPELKNRFSFNKKSLCILLLAPGVFFLLRHLSQRFLLQSPSTFPNSPKLESVSSASKKLVESRVCQSLRPSIVTIYARSEVGSGSIIDLRHHAAIKSTSNFILTNSHVVLPAEDGQVNVAIESKSFFIGKVVATDPTNDLAIVQLNVQDPLRQKVSLAETTNKPQAGQLICTIGNPFNRSGIMTIGKLKGERGGNDLKLDLYINPGNSGGPLIDANGKMIGVIKSALYLPNGKNSGISFAINLASVNRFIQQNLSKLILLSQSSSSLPSSNLPIERPINFNLTAPAPGALNANLESLSPSKSWYGMDVNEDLTIVLVEPDSPAERAGLTGGDQIISIDGNSVKDLGELQRFSSQHPISTEFAIERYQERQKHTILVNKIN